MSNFRPSFEPRWPGSHGYLNTARFGLPSEVVTSAVRQQLEYWREGRFDAHWLEDVEPLRATIGALLGVAADSIGIGRSTSSLVAGIAHSLPDGSRVLVPEGEHNSNTIPFLEQRRRGITVMSGPLDRLAECVTPGTAVVAFSLVQSSDGQIAELSRIAEAARRVGALVCVDGTQGVGWLPFDASLCDVLVVSAYKWLLSPLGVAFIVCSAQAAEWVRPATPNWFACTDPTAAPYGTAFALAEGARRFDVVPALGTIAGAKASIETLAAVGVERIHHHNVALADALRARLGLKAAGSAIVNFAAPGAAARLAAAGVRCTTLGDRVRVSFHLYNTDDDVELVARAIGI